MKKYLLIIVVFTTTLLLSSCQTCTRQFGGTTNIVLEKDQRFVNITWKENDIWVLVENQKENQYEFLEYSNIGVLQGKVIIKNK